MNGDTSSIGPIIILVFFIVTFTLVAISFAMRNTRRKWIFVIEKGRLVKTSYTTSAGGLIIRRGILHWIPWRGEKQSVPISASTQIYISQYPLIFTGDYVEDLQALDTVPHRRFPTLFGVKFDINRIKIQTV